MKLSVVRVSVGFRPPCYSEAWRGESINNRSGTASLIEYKNKHYILTNEHVIRIA